MAEKFGTTTEAEKAKIVEDAVPENTARSTAVWVKAFGAYSRLNLQTCSAAEVADKLEGFFADLKKQDGGTYK